MTVTRHIVLVTGDRDWDNVDVIGAVLQQFPAGTKLIHGDAIGADTVCRLVAEALGFEVVSYPYLREFGYAGGPMRNIQMADENPDITQCVAFHDNIEASRGTKHMLSVCHRRGIPYTLYLSSGDVKAVDPTIFKRKKRLAL